MKDKFKRLLAVIFLIALIPVSLQTYMIIKQKIKKTTPKYHIEYSKSVQKFLHVMGKIESDNNPKTVSSTGYLGKYQFSAATLSGMGFNMPADSFLNDEQMQDSAMVTYMMANEKILYRYIQDCSGYQIGEIKITKAGIIAGAHTHGPGAVIIFLNSNGEIDAEDGNCIKISQRIKQFENINLNF